MAKKTLLVAVALVTSVYATSALGCIDYIFRRCYAGDKTACWLQASRDDVQRAREELEGAAEAFAGNAHYAHAVRLMAKAQRELALARADEARSAQ